MDMQRMFSKVFTWMFLGLFVTAGASVYVAMNPTMLLNIFGTSVYYWLVLLELGLVIFLSARIHKMSFATAGISFLLYSFVSGVTLASIVVVYEISSLILLFGLTALLFLVFGLIGYFTKIDLSKFGNIMFMILLGIIIATLVNIFMGNTMLDIIICCVGIAVFLGIVAYDIQKIKELSYGIEDENKAAIYGALQLYLDFVNIFLYLLQLFGKAKD